MPSSATIKDVSVATIRGQLPAPVIFGDWVMKEREFAAVRITTDKGHEGWAFTLTRDGAGAEQIRKAIAPVYVGTDIADREKTFKIAKGRTYGSHSAGIGLRALSIVDLACWDIAAKLADKPIAEFLGGKAKPMPATAIIGYPPALMPPEKVGEQVRELAAAGWRRFKCPMGVDAGRIGRAPAGRRARQRPTPGLAPTWCWMFPTVDAAAAYADTIVRPQPRLHRGHLPAGQRRQAGRIAQAREDADLARRRTGRLLLSGGADPGQVGRSGARRPDLHGRHHRRPA